MNSKIPATTWSGALAVLATAAILSIAGPSAALAEEADEQAGEQAAPQPPPPDAPCAPCGPLWCEPPPPGCPCPTTCIPDTLLCIPCFDDCIAAYEKCKADSCFKLSAGAYHWFNYDNDTKKLNYGSATAQGTYFYYFEGDIECKSCDPCGPTWGAHAQLRARDDSTFRTFIEDEVWFYELYGYVDTYYGKLEAGKVWKRFGLDWDGTFYGNVAYFDGFKLDPDYGISWEKTWNAKGRFTVDTFAQYFLKQDGINGSIGGADAESSPNFEERNTFVGRAVGTWKLTQNESLAVGLSGYIGTIQHDNGTGSDVTANGWAVDAAFTWCDFKAFGEYMKSNGTLNPAHYVTGGPSDTYDDWLVGAQYKLGMFTPRVVYSHGDYQNPGGNQWLWDVGGTVEITKWLTLYLEYVRWDVQDAGGTTTKYEDGFEIVLNWHV